MTWRCIAALLLVVAPAIIFGAPEIKRIDARYSSNGVELVISGNDFAATREVWSTLAPNLRLLSVAETEIRAHAPGSLPPNLYAARVFASNGVSALVPFVVDDFPSIESASTNTTRSQAQPIPLACAVTGTARDLGFTWFRFDARAGQRVAAETVAGRIGSRLDSVIRILDSRGREVAYSDDAPGVRADSHAAFVAPETGEYFIELRDVNYGGGGEHSYRLRVGDFPFAAATFPVAVQAGTKSPVRLVGDSCGAPALTVSAPERADFLPIASGGAFAKVIVSDMRELLDNEPAVIEVPCAVNGRFEKPGERDVYDLRAAAGQKIAMVAQTRSVGSPCDAVLELQSKNGQRLARSNIGAADEGVITHTFKEAGVYKLVVTEANGASGPSLVYRVLVQPSAGFTLTVETDTAQATPGGEFEIKVSANRSDYKGEINLDLTGIPGLVASNAVMQANKTNATIKVRVPDDLEAGVRRHFDLIGRAAKEESGPTVRASTAAALRKRWPQMLHIPFELDGPIALGIRK